MSKLKPIKNQTKDFNLYTACHKNTHENSSENA